ncbi:hypothetical protein [Actinoplanes utahensis]|uniref:hypothetical protein n=1 Tax=Actinoplanes utahensis TaxID=1869 RepID=UPI001269C2A0|nr:hypothetical protein [Actinoplanes utahensis]GIF30521.1 hypothetical protein Aut01nite_35070 [Actinoplanes utahensis]
MESVRGKSLAWLGHPVTMAALAVLVVNDHVAKAAHPGWVTGKLSDAAGMVLAPPLLAVLTSLFAPRARFRPVAVGALVAVGVGFAFTKAWVYGGQVASEMWSLITPSLVRSDPTDLLALPFLAVAWWTAQRPGRQRSERTERWVRAWRLAVLLPLALAGVAATSAVPYLSAEKVYVSADTIFVGEGWIETRWSASKDGGVTWSDAPEQTPAAPGPACTRSVPQVCYRVIEDGIGVLRSDAGGPWTEDWVLTRLERITLNRAYRDTMGIDALTSQSIGVQDVPGGHVVVVANGRDGFAVRDVTGTWQRIGFPTVPGDLAPASVETDWVLLEFPLGPAVIAMALGLVITTGAVVVMRRRGAPAGYWWLPVALGVTAVMTVPAALAGWADPNGGLVIPMVVLAILGILAAIGCSVAAVIRAGMHLAEARAERRPPRVPPPRIY